MGVKVVDGEVGGGALCGQGLGWDTWGETSSPGKQQISVQNQFDVSDWPCFTKIYLTFPWQACLLEKRSYPQP